ncbi:MAG: ORF6N domain-containing protein [Flavobacteriales bacterium]|nr:ORF6N domain-containing protein [Flavobacteriales bacterium]MBP6698006.1 ORF6N domain-containing protein [Flavobacteriales bacterium]
MPRSSSKAVSKAVQPVASERIMRRIVTLRGERVLLDVHLAELYEVETRTLKQAVRRNRVRFPEDFMYELTKDEAALMVSQGVIPSLRSLGGTTPFAFTEAGVAMLSSVLNSRKAMAMNVAIMRTFTALRRLARNYSSLMSKLKAMEAKYDQRFDEVYELFHALLGPAKPRRKRIGFKPDEVR